jgi:2-amino-4-hydroxy-6-hydroxymethyldihydropteridine diphosphokinase
MTAKEQDVLSPFSFSSCLMQAPSPKKAEALIAFGANQGDCEQALQRTLDFFENDRRIIELSCSSSVHTTPVTGTGDSSDQNEYLNAVLRVLTTHEVHELHEQMIEVEKRLGREREERWGPRTIDLDLLLFGDMKLQSAGLTVPHPRMSFRRFVLQPALEVAADMVHPVSGMTLQQLSDHLDNSDPYILVATNQPEFTSSVIQDVPFELRIVENTADFMANAMKARLVVAIITAADLDEESQTLQRFAENYAGPSLQIDQTLGEEFAVKELSAAVEAMQPWNR